MKKIILFILGCLVIISGIVLAVINWNSFPESIAVHFYADGTANGFAGRPTALVLIPIFMILTHIFLFICLERENRKTRIPVLFELLFTLIMPIIAGIYYLVIFSSIYNYKLDIFLIVYCFISVVFIICGNYLPKIEKSIPLLSRMLGWVFLISGCLILLFTLLKLKFIVYIVIGISVLSIITISILYEKKRNEKND